VCVISSTTARGRASIMQRSNEEVRVDVEDNVHYEIQRYDENQELRSKDYNAIHAEISDEVFALLLDANRPQMNDSDYEFMKSRVETMVQEIFDRGPVQSRFKKFERVVCKIGGERGWGPGTIQALDEDDPNDPTGQSKLPYVVKLDPPVGRLISVPYDENKICRAEVCFGQLSKADIGFTLRCKPQRKETHARRFGVGDRVACAVESADGEYTVWAAGAVADVDYNVEPDASEAGLTWSFSGGAGIVPYRVLLDSGAHVFVHRDVHWLVRDLALQPAGLRQAEDGSRDLKRLVKRRRGESECELIDHETRKVRIEPVCDLDDESDEDAPAAVS
jgi:hypothetical protein